MGSRKRCEIGFPSSENGKCPNLSEALQEVCRCRKTILQWIPVHCGIQWESGSLKSVFDRAHATRTRSRFNVPSKRCGITFQPKWHTKIHTRTGREAKIPTVPPLGFKPRTFGMVGALTTAEPRTPQSPILLLLLLVRRCWRNYVALPLCAYTKEVLSGQSIGSRKREMSSDYHLLPRDQQVILMRRRTGHNRLNNT